MQRRELFTGLAQRLKNEPKSIPPPYLVGSLSVCGDCDAPCVNVCETSILSHTKEGGLEVSFAKQGCTYCKACAVACDKGVLDETAVAQMKIDIYIDESACVAHHSVMCMSCKDPCLDNAIDFNGLFKPVINPLACTSCGFCIAVCPTEAIKVLL